MKGGFVDVGKIISIEENLPHKVSEVVCLKCLHRWIAVRPVGTKLKQLECPECGGFYAIETGEEINEE